MNNLVRSYRPLWLAVSLLALTAGAHAGTISISLLAPVLTGSPGDVLTFGGTIVNNAGADLFINGAGITLAGFGQNDTDLTSFILNATGPLHDAGSLGPVDFFTVAIPAFFASGRYTGTLLVQGGATELDDYVLGSAGFEVDVTPGALTGVPEPASLELVASAITSMLFVRLRKSFQS